MLSGMCFGCNDLERSGQFYDAVLTPLNYQRLFQNKVEIGYGCANKPNSSPDFWILTPFNKQAATHGNGTQVMFEAKNQDVVDQCHQAAIDSGGKNDGAPGPRDYRPGYYGAYFRDLDGNKVHVFCIAKS